MDSEARYHGYCRAMEEAGIPVDERLVCAGEYTQEGGAAAVEKLISQDFTAIFACNDASAYGVCRKLKEYRKKVPEDVSVVGYDDVFYARMLGGAADNDTPAGTGDGKRGGTAASETDTGT